MSDGTFYTASSGGHDSMMPSGQGKGASRDILEFIFCTVFVILLVRVTKVQLSNEGCLCPWTVITFW